MINDKMKIIAEQQSQRVVLKGNTIKYNNFVNGNLNTTYIKASGIEFEIKVGTNSNNEIQYLNDINVPSGHKVLVLVKITQNAAYTSTYENDIRLGAYQTSPASYQGNIQLLNNASKNEYADFFTLTNNANKIFIRRGQNVNITNAIKGTLVYIDLTELGLADISTLTDFYATDLGKFIQKGSVLPYSATNTIYSVKSPFTFKREIEYNNLVQNGNFDVSSDWSVYGGSSGGTLVIANNKVTINYNGTFSSDYSQGLYQSKTIIQGHKYYCAFKVRLNTNSKITTEIGGDRLNQTETLNANQLYNVGFVATANTVYSNVFMVYPSSVLSNGQTMEISNIMLIDLTQLGLDSINSVEDFYKTMLGRLVKNGAKLQYTTTNKEIKEINDLTYIRTKRVDLGTLTWEYQSGNQRFACVQNFGQKGCGTSAYDKGNIKCGKYETVSLGDLANKTIAVYVDTTPYLYIRDTDYENANDLKQALSGVILEYETAEPLELNGFDNDKALDLGALTWYKRGDYFASQVIGTIPFISSSVAFKGKCQRYEPISINDLSPTTDKRIALSSSNELWVYDSTFANKTADDFKNSLNGIILTYETDKPSIFDTYENHSGKVVRKIKRVKINDLDLTKSGSNFNVTLTDIKSHSGTTKTPQLLCSDYRVVSPVEVTLANQVISQNNKVLTIKDTNYSSIIAFKSAKGNVDIYYILETQTTENERSVLVDHRYNKVVDSNGNEIDTD